MDPTKRLDQVDDELKLLKNEIKQVLLEIQEQVLNVQNPFVGLAANLSMNPRSDAKEVVTKSEVTTENGLVPGHGRETLAPPPPVAQIPVQAPPPPVVQVPIQAAPPPVAQVAVQAPPPPVVQVPVQAPPPPAAEVAVQAPPPPAAEVPVQAPRPPVAQVPIEAPPREPPSPEPPPLQRRGSEAEPTDQDAELIDYYGDAVREDAPAEESTVVESPGESTARTRAVRRSAKTHPLEVPSKGEPGNETTPDETKAEAQDGVGFRETPSPLELAKEPAPVDLVTVAGLATWTEQVIAKLGSEHAKMLLELSDLRGRLPPELRDIVLVLARIFDARQENSNLTAKDVVSLLAQLDALSGNNLPADSKLISLLIHGDMEGPPLAR